MALYHTHRPQTFSALIGQEHIAQVLINAVKQKKVAHAYLFSGPRGLGKTTTARLMAKAINCLENKGEPCNKCQNCLKISENKTLDVFEIDAASNRGIDEIRELREMVKFGSGELPKKVIIIDEVHMLTKEAFNALLKTLEEPPENVVFILATTEPHKVEPTILSRVQRFDFRRATPENITETILTIAKKEKIDITKKAANLLASFSEGSYRDGVSLLDQLSSSTQETIDEKKVESILGISSQETIESFIQSIDDDNPQAAFKILDQFIGNGGDSGYFLTQLINYIRGEIRENISQKNSQYLESLLKSYEQSKISPINTLPLEIFISENTFANENINQPSPTKKPSRQPKNVQETKKTKPDPDISPASQDNEESATNEKITPPSPSSLKSIEKKIANHQTPNLNDNDWLTIINAIKTQNAPLAAVLQGSHLKKAEDGSLCIAVKFAFHKGKIMDKKCLPMIEAEIEKLINQSVRLTCVIDKEFIASKEKASPPSEDLVSNAQDVFGS